MSSAQRLLPGAAPVGGGGLPPDDPLAAYVISWLRFEDAPGTSIPVDQVPSVIWANSDAARTFVSAVDARGGNRSLRRNPAGGIAGGLYTTLSALVGNQWTLEFYHRYTAKTYGAGNNRIFQLGRNTSHLFIINTTSADAVLLEYPTGNITLAATMAIGPWYHVAIVSDGVEVRTYIDHVLVHTLARNANYQGNVTAVEYSPGRAYNMNGDFHDGYTDEARLTLAVRSVSQFLPLEGYAAPGEARSRSISGHRATLTRGSLGGGVGANSAALPSLRATARAGSFAGGVKIQGRRTSAIRGQITAYPFGQLQYVRETSSVPSDFYTAATFGRSGGAFTGDGCELSFLPDGTVTFASIFGGVVNAPIEIDRWLTEAIPAYYLECFQISATVSQAGEKFGTGQYPSGTSGFLTTPYRVRGVMAENMALGTHVFVITVNIQVSYFPERFGDFYPRVRTGAAAPGGFHSANHGYYFVLQQL